MADPQGQPLSLQLAHTTLAGLYWPATSEQSQEPVLALHGWLDNAASFVPLAPYLEQELLAIDLPGHGLSGHRPEGVQQHIVDYVRDIQLLLEAQNWSRVTLLGHSMGAAIAMLFAAAFPERVSRLLLIDGLGPLSSPESQVANGLRKAMDDLDRLAEKVPSWYPNKAAAITARMAGFTPLSEAAASLLCERALTPANGGYQWRSDPRLRCASALRMSESQIAGFLQAVQAPVCVIGAEQGLAGQGLFAERLTKLAQGRLEMLPGGHHLHMEQPAAVASLIQRVLQE